ncbi:hypothetical protein [Komagataeibacter sp. FNDCF1]|uniref:hypothetical protein n=1 Tax=Komagataeibacter sp. FNDCF1 TaxID=2878681 RepID=UPI001E511B65|nr:hypothetical protein [Komagataeibacter sp. FNDCF1]MCE2564527.1 hypothetical protein [Komagataeibacter sp. FNDCF1]
MDRKEPYALMSFHGSVMVMRDGVCQLQDPRNVTPDDCLHIQPENIRLGKTIINSRSFSTDFHTGRDTVSFSHGGTFLTAEADGSLTTTATACQAWEHFRLVPLSSLVTFHAAMQAFWRAEDDSIRVRGVHIHTLPDFWIRFGPFRFPLEQIDQVMKDGTVTIGKSLSATPHDLVFHHDTSPAGHTPVIWIKPLGNTANRAMQYLVARHIQHSVPHATIENIFLPEWNIDTRTPPLPLENGCRLGWDRFWIDIAGLADCLRRGVIETLFLDSFSFNIDHIPPRAICRRILPATTMAEDVEVFGPDTIVCNIRAGEVLENAHPDYIVLPPEYYRLVVQDCGLEPVFFGQLDDNAYVDSLRRAFPHARFIHGRGPEHDFAVLQRAANIAISVSTFSWLAAWLGSAQRVYMPLGGMFNPNQNKLQNFMPLEEQDFRFVLLPTCQAENLYRNPEQFFHKQAFLGHNARILTRGQARKLLDRSRRHWPPQPLVYGFDAAYYTAAHPEVQDELHNGLPSALEHYMHNGFHRGYAPHPFDATFYGMTHPDAALAVAQGHYASLHEHYQKKGIFLGYEACPAGKRDQTGQN